MSELLDRALKLADDAEEFARRIKHSEAVTIEGEFERVEPGKQAINDNSERQENTMQTYSIVDGNGNVVDGLKKLSQDDAEHALNRQLNLDVDCYIQDE